MTIFIVLLLSKTITFTLIGNMTLFLRLINNNEIGRIGDFSFITAPSLLELQDDSFDFNMTS